jgi:hypothetical protein
MLCPIPDRKKQRLRAIQSHTLNPVPRAKKAPGTFYRPRNHETPFFKIVTSFFKNKVVALRTLYCKFLPFVRDHFDEFERIYPERYQSKYGYWRP